MRKALFRTMLLVVALVATIQSSLMAQNIKTYNGALCKPNTMICALDVEVFNEVSYEYYENEDYARVWHGRFTALYSRYKDDRSVVGCYEHGVQSGVWKESGVFYDKQWYLSYNFLNGKLHGDYHFESEDLVISAMFCDNHLSGSISVVGQNGQFSLSGQFDEDGFACGEWEVKYLDYNRIPFIRAYVYDKGQVLSIVVIDDSTGERTTYSDQNGEDRRLLSYSGLDSWFSYKMPLYDLLSRRFVNPFNKASYNDATATMNQSALFKPRTSDKLYEEVDAADDSAVYHIVEAGDTFGSLAVKYNTSTKRIQELNPDVDPTRLIIGQKIRVKGNKPLHAEENVPEIGHRATPDGWGDAKSGNDNAKGKYQGTCTVSYSFTEPVRKHKSLCLPDCRARGGGVVVLDVWLDRNGAVASARVASSTNASLNQIALQAACNYNTRFNIDGSAPASHKGTITYTFLTSM